jgi:transcriptional antiterminator NusG
MEQQEKNPTMSPNESMKWFIIKTPTGQENKVTRALKESIVNYKLNDFFSEIVVPEENVMTLVNGKKRAMKKKFFPGYILIKMIMNEKTWHLVNSVDKVSGFVGGTKDKPLPLPEEEALAMLGQIQNSQKKVRNIATFNPGETVKVIEGPFSSFVGTVESTNEKGKVKVNVSIFGRPTPVELDFSQVEKVVS